MMSKKQECRQVFLFYFGRKSVLDFVGVFGYNGS
jgi:hypothetical protein